MRGRSNSRLETDRRSIYPEDPHEEHYTVQEIAKKWKVDAETVRRTFIDEEGVLIFGEQDRRDGKRAYLTLRIPESVLKRVYTERTRRKFHSPKTRAAMVRGQARHSNNKLTFGEAE